MTPSSEGQSRIPLTIFGAVLAAGLLVFFVIRPQLARISAVQAETAKARQELAVLQNQITGFQQAATELRKVEGQRQAIVALYPAREQMEHNVLGLEQAGSLSGLAFVLKITDRFEQEFAGNIEKKPPVITGLRFLEEVPFTMNVSGSYRQILDFFQYFEHLPYLNKMTALSVVADKAEGEEEGLRNSGLASGSAEGLFFMRTE